METTKLTLKLAVPMNEAKEMEIHREISKVLKEIAGIEEQKKRLSPLKARMNELNLSIEAQTVEAEVECEEFEDLETGLIKTRRLDTNEIFKSRRMDDEERQLKMPGSDISQSVKDKLADLNKTEEQALAGSPEEAEQLRETRLKEEKATRAFESIRGAGSLDGVKVEIKVGDDWVLTGVESVSEFHFTIGEAIYDVSKYDVSWRQPPTWNDVVTESQEKARLAEIAALAEKQAEGKKTKKATLKRPTRGPKPIAEGKHVSVQNDEGKEIARGVKDGEEAPPAPPAELCSPTCEIDHQHTEQRTAF
jgi:hypothetical protein